MSAALVRVARCGECGVLIEVVDNPAVHAVAAAACERWRDSLVEVVPGETTVLLVWQRPVTDLDAVTETIRELLVRASDDRSILVAAGEVRIPVRYDGDDLPSVARAAGMSPEEVVRRHCTPAYRAAFMGFAPGFAYLLGGDPDLRLPRRDTPRSRVPAGSVAIAAGYSAVYPRESPGGWHLIGRTDVRLFDASADPPALIAPGARVRFEAL